MQIKLVESHLLSKVSNVQLPKQHWEDAKAPFTLPIQGRFTVPICCLAILYKKAPYQFWGFVLTAPHHPHVSTGNWICDYNLLWSCCRCASTVFMSKHIMFYSPVMFWQQCTSDIYVIRLVGLKHHAATCQYLCKMNTGVPLGQLFYAQCKKAN